LVSSPGIHCSTVHWAVSVAERMCCSYTSQDVLKIEAQTECLPGSVLVNLSHNDSHSKDHHHYLHWRNKKLIKVI
jgi:hypothetical protein